MAEDTMLRRLTTILSADVVGYSRLMGEDEAGTLAALKKHRKELLSPKEAQYHGRTIKLMGDGALLEFGSVVDAVQYAIEVQLAMQERNAKIPEDKRIIYRIGINVGDIIADDDDIYGDGVNVSSRLETLAEPGGICVRRNVRNQVRDKLDLDFEDMGEVEVKNIARPIRVFRIVLNRKASKLRTPVLKPPTINKPSRKWVLGAAITALLAMVALTAMWLPSSLQTEPNWDPTLTLPDKPSIAVLSFDNMSEDPDQDYFADGMSEDIITDLSKISGLFVTARNSSFQYKGQATDVRQIAAELGVRYILEGSVRRVSDQIRINAQLIDAKTGGHVWADRYDGSMDNVFSLQDEITGKIVTALRVSITAVEQAKRRSEQTAFPEAYDAFLKGWSHYRKSTPEDFAQAASYFEQALALDPDYSRAHAALALLYSTVAEKNWSTGTSVWSLALNITMAEGLRREQIHLEKSMRSPVLLSHLVAARQMIRRRQHSAAMKEAKLAVALEPNDPLGHEAMGMALLYAGQHEQAINHVELAMRIDPQSVDHYRLLLGLAQFCLEDYENAVMTLERLVLARPDDDRARIILAASYGHLNRVAEGAESIEQANLIRTKRQNDVVKRPEVEVGVDVLLVGPYSLEDLDFWPFQQPRDRERLREGLRLAGMPEAGDTTQVSPLLVDGAKTISPAEAKALHEDGVIFIDVRPKSLWDNGHIPNAINLDFKNGFNESALTALISKEERAVIYCMGPRCLLSSKACAQAVSWGFRHIFYLREGYPGWQTAGYETVIP